MPPSDVALLALFILLAAVLYSSVGHAGASGYLAVMALFGLAPDIMKPTALVLNILVATIATARFYRAGFFTWSGLWPFLLGSIPLSFVGGALQLPGVIYKPLVGAVLLFAAYRLFRFTERGSTTTAASTISTLPAVTSGAVIGLLSGLTGTGGGIFLSPLLLFKGWGDTRQSAGISSAFILANSLAGLTGNVTSVQFLPTQIPFWAAAAVIGGLIGAELGSRHLADALFRRLLALVLLIAGLKLILSEIPKGFLEQVTSTLPIRQLGHVARRGVL